MITAIDSSVLIAIIYGESGAEAWVHTLSAARTTSRLVGCGIVYAESSRALDSHAEFDDVLAKFGIDFDPLQPASAYFAGQIFSAYRRNGGPREHLIPDFLVAAHAQVQADRLAAVAVDRGYLRRYFPGLSLLVPEPESGSRSSS